MALKEKNDINIADIEINDNGDGTITLWFVAISGEHGPKLKMPYSLLNNLKTKMEEFYKSKQ